MYIYLNGNFVTEEDARISVFDHGFLYGDGVFEGIRAYNGRIFALDEHVDRFYESAKSIMLELPLAPSDFREAILETVRRNKLRDAYIRPVASRGKGPLGLDPTKCPKPTLVIIVDPEVRHPENLDQTAMGAKGINVITTTFRRNGHDILSPRIKSTNYLNNILAKLQAHAAGAQEALFLNAQGLVCELTADNLFIVKNSRVITPPLWVGLLDGITRRAIIRLAREQNLEITEEPLTLHDLYTSDECFATASRIEILAVSSIDGRRIGDGTMGPVTSQIKRAFMEIVNREGAPIY
ncbi:MAG: branched-chain-amino-acid transaminase [Deltaproteobacteria bacterium]|nr:branched-chain-amino-acid transaminase [Deltaproteobacteria bacterium]